MRNFQLFQQKQTLYENKIRVGKQFFVTLFAIEQKGCASKQRVCTGYFMKQEPLQRAKREKESLKTFAAGMSFSSSQPKRSARVAAKNSE
jgi:hypothetical protein